MTATKVFTDISPERLALMMEERSALVILDVREPFELSTFGAIPGVKNIPLKTLPGRLGELPQDRSLAIALVCQSGNRSRDAARYLSSVGFTELYNLKGGTLAWMMEGRPLERRPDS